jgi:hypothetical protein
MNRNSLLSLIAAACLFGGTPALAGQNSTTKPEHPVIGPSQATGAFDAKGPSGACSPTTIGSATGGAGAGKAKFNDVNCGSKSSPFSGAIDQGDEWHNADGSLKGGGKQTDGGGQQVQGGGKQTDGGGQQVQGGGKQVDGGGQQTEGGGKRAGGPSSERCKTCN